MMTHAEVIASVKVTAELIGSRAPSDDAMTVLVSRLKDHPEAVIKSTLKWLGENETGSFTLQKLVKALASVASSPGGSGGGMARCAANGCPLPGTIFVGQSLCRFHLDDSVGPKADAITTALRRNAEKLKAITDLSNTAGVHALGIEQKLTRQVAADVAHEIGQNAERIKAYTAADVKANSVVDRLQDSLRRWGVAA